MTNPWVGPRPFETSERHLFYGRDRESRVLTNLIATLPAVIVYAPSGTGKSSLLNAGVIPALKSSHSVVSIRKPRDDVFELTRNALGELGSDATEETTLGGMLERHWRDTDSRTVIVVDQFEERTNSGIAVDDVFDIVAQLTHSGTDAGCVVISIREDYLGTLEPVMRRVPGLLNSSYRVPVLSRTDLKAAVYGPLGTLDQEVSVEDDLVEQSLNDLDAQSTRQQEPGEQRFEPGYFQIVWSRLWDELPDDASRAGLTLSHYRDLGSADQILKDFTADTLESLEPAEAELFWAMSRYLVLPTGAKVALTLDDLAELLRPSDYLAVGRVASWLIDIQPGERELLIHRVFDDLTSSRAPLFQRVIRSDREEYELLHDLIGRILLDWRKEYEQQWKDRTVEARSLADRQFYRVIRRSDSRPYGPPSSDEFRTVVRSSTAQLRSYVDRLRRNDESFTSDRQDTEAAELMAVRVGLTGTGEYTFRPSIRVKRRVVERFEDEIDEWKAVWREAEAEGVSNSSELVRRGIQRLIPVRPLPMDFEVRPLGSRFQYLAASATGLALGVVGAILAYLCVDAVTGELDIQYAGLTLANVALVFGLLYMAIFNDADGSLPQRALACAVPFTAETDDYGRLLGTWPLPILATGAAGLGGAWLFDALGWAATAGFNEGVVVGGIAALLGAITTSDL